MFISEIKLRSIKAKEYARGYNDGRADGYTKGERDGYRKGIFSKYTVNNIRRAFDLPPINPDIELIREKEEKIAALEEENRRLKRKLDTIVAFIDGAINDTK